MHEFDWIDSGLEPPVATQVTPRKVTNIDDAGLLLQYAALSWVVEHQDLMRGTDLARAAEDYQTAERALLEAMVK